MEGKPVGIDLQAGKKTLMIIQLLYIII